jgi:hypothetical protein
MKLPVGTKVWFEGEGPEPEEIINVKDGVVTFKANNDMIVTDRTWEEYWGDDKPTKIQYPFNKYIEALWG